MWRYTVLQLVGDSDVRTADRTVVLSGYLAITASIAVVSPLSDGRLPCLLWGWASWGLLHDRLVDGILLLLIVDPQRSEPFSEFSRDMCPPGSDISPVRAELGPLWGELP
jgi:hypothetical protein